jgi:redox-regulated HSP33 family molecular chaperone
MATVYYVDCKFCGKQYYIDANLYNIVKSNPKQLLKCPFCKKEFPYKQEKMSER